MDASPARPARSRRAAATAVVVALVALGAGGLWARARRDSPSRLPALALARPAVGVQFHATWRNYEESQLATVVDRLAEAGVRWVRIDIGWRSLEPDVPGRFDEWYLRRSDRAVAVAASRGLKVLATLWTTPEWANGGRSRIVPPTDPAAYASVARRLAARWRGTVAAWEVWNEPNHEDFWEGRRPDTYAALVRAAYPAFKAGDPAALVVAGAVAYNDTEWLQAMYDAGAAGSFDVLSTHPYTLPSDLPPDAGDPAESETFGHLAAVRALMDARGDAGKPIWATEMGWSTHATRPGADRWERGVTPEVQAGHLVRAVRLLAAEHPDVTVAFWYRERDLRTGDEHFDGFGLLTHDLRPKPAYEALRRLLLRG